MQTTFDLNDELIVRLKALAEQRHLSLNGLVETALQGYLLASSEASVPSLPVYHGWGGLTPAVTDALSARSLLDAADADTTKIL